MIEDKDEIPDALISSQQDQGERQSVESRQRQHFVPPVPDQDHPRIRKQPDQHQYTDAELDVLADPDHPQMSVSILDFLLVVTWQKSHFNL